MSYTYRNITCTAFRETKLARSWSLNLYITGIGQGALERAVFVCELDDTDPLDVAVQVYWPKIVRELYRRFFSYFQYTVHTGSVLRVTNPSRSDVEVLLPPIEILGIENDDAYEGAFEGWLAARR